MKRLKRGSPTQRAARLVPVSDVLEWLGIPSPGTPGPGVSVKVTCPFTETHPPDRSGEKDMRLYGDGKAFCHMCATQYDSVAMVAQAWSLSRSEAARVVLARSGIEFSDDDDVTRLSNYVAPSTSRAGAIAALGKWADRVGVDRFSEPYARCIRAADQITKQEHVNQWIVACKNFLENHAQNKL